MKTILTILSITIMSASSFACDCNWGGDFFTMSNQTDLVVKVIVTKKIKGPNDFNIKMDVDVIEVFKGDETRKKITIWGDDGAECRPYIDYFKLGETYYLSLHKYDNEYEQMNCGEMYLQVKDDRVIGETRIRSDLPQVGEMTIKEFETKLKEKIK